VRDWEGVGWGGGVEGGGGGGVVVVAQEYAVGREQQQATLTSSPGDSGSHLESGCACNVPDSAEIEARTSSLALLNALLIRFDRRFRLRHCVGF